MSEQDTLRAIAECDCGQAAAFAGRGHEDVPCAHRSDCPVYRSSDLNPDVRRDALIEAAKGVLRVADRATIEFDALKTAINQYEGEKRNKADA